ncbi:hypothetical protein C2845_PM07G13170 [Panicum miliaceum]|uniref:Uncharacterized protein n=1 Tax=Panicum miliaceum TaxID=4540 RepID=A0A3L6SLD2_PANMI|nr:hypothetical protein C2845_PM07G13170 [Panicum miliaceum]
MGRPLTRPSSTRFCSSRPPLKKRKTGSEERLASSFSQAGTVASWHGEFQLPQSTPMLVMAAMRCQGGRGPRGVDKDDAPKMQCERVPLPDGVSSSVIGEFLSCGACHVHRHIEFLHAVMVLT